MELDDGDLDPGDSDNHPEYGCDDPNCPDCYCYQPIIRAKWIMDGATTLAEAAVKLRAYAQELDLLAATGWELEHQIDDDYGFLRWTHSRASRPAWYEGDPAPTETPDGTPLSTDA